MPASSFRTAMTMTAEPVGVGGLYRLLAWLSPAFPTGGFSYSHGLEAAAGAGTVSDRATLQGWIAAVVVKGSGRMDADILRDAYRAAVAADGIALAAANRRGLAYRASAELALESAAQGEAFLATCRAAWPNAFLEAWAAPEPLPLPAGGKREGPAPRAWEGEGHCQAAAFGAAAGSAGVALGDALIGYLQALAANLMSAGLRLGLIGQTDGQRILAALEPVITAAADAALTREPGDFGAASFAVDLASMAHETQYTRLFRS